MTLSLIMPWLPSIFLGCLSALIIGSNYYSLFDTYRHQGHTSLVLFLGGLFGAIAIITAPLSDLQKIAAIAPLIIDPGCLAALYYIVRPTSKKPR